MALDYTIVYASAKSEMQELEAEKTRLETALADCGKRMAALHQMINAMASLVGEEPTEAPSGMTDCIRTILLTSDEPLSATDVRNRLEEMGFDLSSYSNPMANIHTVLKRLTEAEEIRTTHALERGAKKFSRKLEKLAGKSFELGKMKGFVGIARLRRHYE